MEGIRVCGALLRGFSRHGFESLADFFTAPHRSAARSCVAQPDKMMFLRVKSVFVRMTALENLR